MVVCGKPAQFNICSVAGLIVEWHQKLNGYRQYKASQKNKKSFQWSNNDAALLMKNWAERIWKKRYMNETVPYLLCTRGFQMWVTLSISLQPFFPSTFIHFSINQRVIKIEFLNPCNFLLTAQINKNINNTKCFQFEIFVLELKIEKLHAGYTNLLYWKARIHCGAPQGSI